MLNLRISWMLGVLLTSIFLYTAPALAQQWHSNGPYGADVTTIEVAAWDSSKVILGTRFDGLYIRDIDGEVWQRFAPGLPQWAQTIPRSPEDDYSEQVTVWGGDYPIVHDVATMTGDSDIILVGLGYRLQFSQDGGETFEIIFDGSNDLMEIRQVWMLPGDTDCMMFIGSSQQAGNKLYVTNTGGFIWEEQPYQGVLGFTVDPFDPVHVLMYGAINAAVGVDCGIYETFDAGLNWAPVNEDVPTVLQLVASPLEEGVWAGIGSTEVESGLFYTRDDFSQLPLVEGSLNTQWVEFKTDGRLIGYDADRSINYQDILLPESGTVAQWDDLTYDVDAALFPRPNYQKVVYPVPGMDDVVFFGSKYGVALSTTAGSTIEWQDLGLRNARIDRVKASPNLAHVWYAFGVGGAWGTVDDGNHWTRMTAVPTWDVTEKPGGDTVLFATDGGLFRGEGPLQELTQLPGIGHGIKLGYANEDTLWAVQAFDGDPQTASYSLDDGSSWTEAFNWEMSTESHLDFAADGTLLIAGEVMLRYYPQDESPEFIDIPSIATGLLADRIDPDRMVMSVPNNVYETQNGGETWSSMGSQFVPRCTAGRTMGGILSDGVSEEGLYALIRGEDLYHRIGPGNPWTHVDMPIDIDWRTIDFTMSSDTLLAIATHSKGVWIRGGFINDLPEHDEEQVVLPGGFELRPAWPNPFNPSTNLTFRLSAPGHVSMHVYDLQGRMVDTIFEGEATAGSHTINWHAESMASGVYFVRLRTNQGSQVRKVIRLQ
ncbi:T9SS type A sorting domain-containing protein [bacterium]|nr:T9SS type A sorting domain-containing protein [bacterium]